MKFISMWFMLVLLLAFFGGGKALYEEDNTQDVYNFTNNLNWNSSIIPAEEIIYNSTSMNISQANMIRLKNIVYKSVDTVGYIIFETAKWGVETGFRNPDWNYLWLAKWLIILIIIMIALPLLGLFPIIIALIYLSYVGIKQLYLKIKTKLKNE